MAFGKFYSMENGHSVNSGKFIGQNSVINAEKIETFIKQSFILEGLNFFWFLAGNENCIEAFWTEMFFEHLSVILSTHCTVQCK